METTSKDWGKTEADSRRRQEATYDLLRPLCYRITRDQKYRIIISKTGPIDEERVCAASTEESKSNQLWAGLQGHKKQQPRLVKYKPWLLIRRSKQNQISMAA